MVSVNLWFYHSKHTSDMSPGLPGALLSYKNAPNRFSTFLDGHKLSATNLGQFGYDSWNEKSKQKILVKQPSSPWNMGLTLEKSNIIIHVFTQTMTKPPWTRTFQVPDVSSALLRTLNFFCYDSWFQNILYGLLLYILTYCQLAIIEKQHLSLPQEVVLSPTPRLCTVPYSETSNSRPE